MPNQRDASGLTPREKQVIGCLAEGKSQAQIAQTLGISVRTVSNLLTTARLRTGTRNSVHLLAYAVQQGLIH